MKWIAIAILLVGIILCAGCTSTNPSTSGTSTPAATPPTTSPIVTTKTIIPDLIGIWSGNATGISTVKGYVENLPMKYNITVQKGQLFAGIKEHERPDGTVLTENFTGIISSSGDIYLADDIAGIQIGKMKDPNNLEFIYVEDGTDSKTMIFYLTRNKS
jgi:hypothetical protein